MSMQFPLYPAVNSALNETRNLFFHGSSLIQMRFHKITSEDREIAERFDVAEAIETAKKERKEAGLS